MQKAIQYIRADDCIDQYPSIADQIRTLNQYAQEHQIYIEQVFVDSEIYIQVTIYDAINYCIDKKIDTIIMYNYQSLAHKSIDRVEMSKLLYEKGLKILFCL